MNQRLSGSPLAFIVAIAVTGCAAPKQLTKAQVFRGHWTEGAAFSWFTPVDRKESYQVYERDMPKSAVDFLRAQPSRRDKSSESGRSLSAYFELEGVLLDEEMNGERVKRLHASRVLREEPARSNFIEAVEKRGAGQWQKETESSDVDRDIKLMWSTKRLPDSHGFASTDEAIEAAERIFNTVSLIGITRDEVTALLGDPHHSNESQYKFPFWAAPKDAMFYRFDSGSYGWQFNVLFGRNGKVRKVERKWIY